MKIKLLSNLAAIILVISSLSSSAQGNQPSGNLILGPDGNLYGVYMKTITPDKRTATIFKYVPGSSTVDPIYRFEDHAVEIFYVQGAYVHGIAIPYNSNNEPTRNKEFAVETSGKSFSLNLNANTNKGINYHLASVPISLNGLELTYEYALRSGGGSYGYGGVMFLTWTWADFQSPATRATSLIPHHALNDVPDLGFTKGETIGYWLATTAGGTFGKGSIQGYDFYGWNLDYFPSGEWKYTPRVDFTGYGGGGLDGEGPVSIVNDYEAAIYAVTNRGGANNEGALFYINGDGHVKLHDFNSPGRPFGKPFVEPGGKLYGLGGNADNNTNFIYSYTRPTGTFNTVASFGPSTVVNGVTSIVMANNGVIYGTAGTTGSDSNNGCLFAINPDGTNAQVIFKFIDGYTHLTKPYHEQTEVAVIPELAMFTRLDGVNNYRVEISETEDFSANVHVVNTTDGLDKIDPPGLKYSTRYYARVKTDLIDDYGTVTSFTTHAPEKYSFVSSPVHGAINVPVVSTKVTANIVYGATSYTIELNTAPDFTGTSIVKSSALANQRTITFDGLQPSTTYYTRTKTNFPSDWGPTRSFTTAGAAPPPIVVAETRELNIYPNPFEHNFTIDPNGSENINVSLIDLTGRELIKTQVTQPTALGDQLVPGIYVLRIKEQDGSISVRRMVKR